MKNLRIITSCLIAGVHVEAGSIVENIDNHLAADLVSSGRAEEITTPPTKGEVAAKKLDSDSVLSRDPSSENRDPKVLGETVIEGTAEVEGPTGKTKEIKTARDKPKQ